MPAVSRLLLAVLFPSVVLALQFAASREMPASTTHPPSSFLRQHSKLGSHPWRRQRQQARVTRKLLQQLQGHDSEFIVNRLSNAALRSAVNGTYDSFNTGKVGSALGGFNVLGLNFAANGLLGGAVARRQEFSAASDRESASTAAAVKLAAVSQPTNGIVTARSSLDSVSLAQRPLGSSSSNGGSSSSSSSSTGSDAAAPVPRDLELLLAATTDYSIAGDAAIVVAIQEDSRAMLRRAADNQYLLDYDYGQPLLVPQSATTSTRHATQVDSKQGRAAASGSSFGSVTAPAAVANSHAVSSTLRGLVSARQADDAFSKAQVVSPPVKLAASGAEALSLGKSRNWKLQLPSFAAGRAAASSSVGPAAATGSGGGSSSSSSTTTTMLLQGTKSVRGRSRTTALNSCVELDAC